MKKLMAANWKMYKTVDEAQKTAKELIDLLPGLPLADREVLLFPPFTALHAVTSVTFGVPGFHVGGQNLYPAKEGAFTGEVSAGMLCAAGCSYVLTGHSERRKILGENNAFVAEKTHFALENGLRVVLCIGETIDEREQGRIEAVLGEQLAVGVAQVRQDLSPEYLSIAYEPVWAIGTGKVAGPEEILDAHAFIRKKLIALLPRIGQTIRILYGGSVKPDNVREILRLDNVDGVLVGGASLQAESFSRIVLG